MKITMKSKLILLLIAFVTFGTAAADTGSGDILRAEFWAALDPYDPAAGAPRRLSDEEAIRALLEIARTCFGGMVYGWDFRYVPSDETRGVAERFELASYSTIPWGDPAFRVTEARTNSARYIAWIEYRLNADQERRRQSWETGGIAPSQGTGSANVLIGPSAFAEALSAAAKDALRANLRPIVRNKPKSISGRLELERPPLIGEDSGGILVQARFRIEVGEILPYAAF
jgi:hypothetical protein